MTKEYSVVDDLDLFKSTYSSFVNNVEIVDFEHDESPVAMGCRFKKQEKCGIKSCGQYHKYGFIIQTKCNKFYNIGQHCGRSHFGVDFDAWTAGYEAKQKIESEKSGLINEPPKKIEQIKKALPSFVKLDRINNFIWDHIEPIAKEAHERKRDGLYRGLEFIERRLSLETRISECEKELQDIIQQVGQGAAEQEESRTVLLKRFRGIKDRIIKIENMKAVSLAFFNTEPGVGVKDRGANLIRVFTNFKCASNSVVVSCDVTTEPGSVIVTSCNKKVNADGIFKV